MLEAKRIARIDEILRRKQPDLQLFCDNLHSSQNLSAIIRSCDGAGVLHLAYATEDECQLKIHKTITQGAHRWVERKHLCTDEKTAFLKAKQQEGFQIVVTHLDEDAVSFREIDYTGPTLIVVGNEKEGVSREIIAMADHTVIIPMQGMAQSLNVSVATALVLYEAQRQREEKGMYDTPQLSKRERNSLKEAWLHRDVVVRRSKGRIIPLKKS
jgi:tRNA (guanosine-2'-O-)-methyltransferase